MIVPLIERLITFNPTLGNLILEKTPTFVLDYISSLKAAETIDHALETKAYQQILKENKIGSVKLSNLPIIDKKSYIKKFPLRDCLRYRSKDLILIERSSGSTGMPTYWPRFKMQDKFLAEHAYIIMENNFRINEKPTLIINSFALGTWTGGIRFARVMLGIAQNKQSKCCLVNVGANVDEVIKVVKDFQQDFEQIIIGGYPPFVKRVIDKMEDEDVDLKKLCINLITGGEGFSENWRDYIYQKLHINRDNIETGIHLSTYGLADTGSGGSENVLTQTIRYELTKNKALQESFFGPHETVIPAIFQYNPLESYIESIKEELVFTVDTAIPLVRYNIHDRGFVMKFDEVIKLCQKSGFDPIKKLKTKVPQNYRIYRLPFLFLFGRTDGLVIFNGGNIYEDNVRTVLGKKEYLGKFTGNFRMFLTYDQYKDPVFNIYFETLEHLNINEKAEFLNQFIKDLRKINNEYDHMCSYLKERAYPSCSFFHVNDSSSPIYKTEVEIKNKYIRY